MVRPIHILLMVGAVVVSSGSAHATTANTKEPSAAWVQGALAALSDPEDEVVAHAILLISQDGLSAPRVTARIRALARGPLFLEWLRHGDGARRHAAMLALGMLGEETLEATPRIVELLRDSDPADSNEVVGALGRMGGASREVAFQVAVLLEDPKPDIREAAVSALGMMEVGLEAVAPRVAARLEDPEPSVRKAAVKALGAREESAKEYAPLVAARLKDSDLDVRKEALVLLGSLRADGSRYSYQIAELLEDPEAQDLAVEALGKMGASAREHAPRIARLLRSPTFTAQHAAKALSEMGKGSSEVAPHVAALLRDPDPYVRRIALETLRDLGEDAREMTPHVTALLKDSVPNVRKDAVAALGQMSADAKEVVPPIAALLEDSDPDVREAALETLGRLGEHAGDFAPQVATLLKDAVPSVRLEAMETLGKMGRRASVFIPRVAARLTDPERGMKWRAAETLVLLGMDARELVLHLTRLQREGEDVDAAWDASVEEWRSLEEGAKKEVVHHVAGLLKDSTPGIRRRATESLGDLRVDTQQVLSLIAGMLEDAAPEVQLAAVNALGKLGPSAGEYAPDIIELQNDASPDVQEAAAHTLVLLADDARNLDVQLGKLLDDGSPVNRMTALDILRARGAEARRLVPDIIELLSDQEPNVRAAALRAVEAIAPTDVSAITRVLSLSLDDRANRTNWLAHAHLLGGGADSTERVLQWVGRTSDEKPRELSLDEARATLKAFRELWPHTENYRLLRDAFAESIAAVASLTRGKWNGTEDLALLTEHWSNLRQAYPAHADTLQSVLGSNTSWQWLFKLQWVGLAHLTLWLLLVFVYPYSFRVQALFFWNPWTRRLLGLGYVGVLLAWVPFLRRRLLAPFRERLLASAKAERQLAETYFQECEVLAPFSDRPVPLLTAIPTLRKQIILEGASGLGKSMFLRHLLRASKRPAVFLPAARCRVGVLEAIQEMLEGHAKDATFLKSIIYSGALDIYIDGLNEVTTDTRSLITRFVEDNFHGNIILATQRMEWRPPDTAQRYILQPLSEALIEKFLVSREPTLREGARMRGQDYVTACKTFVKESLATEQPEALHQTVRDVLSNPLDLSIVAQLLAEGHVPNLSRLRQQQYELMAADYKEVHLAEFPLLELANEAYRMRCEDRTLVPEKRFSRELLRMESWKMVVRFQWSGPDGRERREWRFRHDKLQEFFIAHTFLGDQDKRVRAHLRDPRFRGVYHLLAFQLPMDKAMQVRELLVEHAADTGDHALFAEFVHLVKARQSAEQTVAA